MTKRIRRLSTLVICTFFLGVSCFTYAIGAVAPGDTLLCQAYLNPDGSIKTCETKGCSMPCDADCFCPDVSPYPAGAVGTNPYDTNTKATRPL